MEDKSDRSSRTTHCHNHDHGHYHGHSHSHGHRDGKASGPFIRIAVSFMMLAVGMSATHFHWTDVSQTWILHWYVLAFLPVGLPVIKEGWETVRSGDIFNEFTLMTIACVGGFCIGEYPEAVGVMLFYSLGETLQDLAVGKATRNISRLVDVRGEWAYVLNGGKYERRKPEDVEIGDMIEVRPGGRVPLDGILEDTDASFDTSALTGESVPITIDKGHEALAGMISSESTVHIRVTKKLADSALSRIMEMVRDASSRKAPAEQFIRKFARIYTPAVTLLAVLLVAVPALAAQFVPTFHYVFSDWLYRGLVFLVISCPCALVISVPLSYFAGIGAASRKGILFKGGNYLEAITHVDTVAFDKTGTLTAGKFHISGIHPRGIEPERLLTLIASAEQTSTHPVARTLVEEARKRGLSLPEAEDVRELRGMGVEAVVDGRKICAGNQRLLRSLEASYPQDIDATVYTVVACVADGEYVGYVEMADTLKPDSREAVERLHDLGINDVILLSGDKKEIASAVAGKLGIDKAFGELMPEDKAGYIEKLNKDDKRNVAFVGDGFNDAPVLALSNVGIAMGGLGSEAAIESADVVIQTDQPSKVATSIEIGRYTRKIVRENIIGAIAIKVVILLLGALGMASLWAAVFADVGVALLAVLNSMRVMWHKFK